LNTPSPLEGEGPGGEGNHANTPPHRTALPRRPSLGAFGHLPPRPHRLRFTDSSFLDHETWVRPAFDTLGDLRGKAALDYGCGHGMAAVVMARAGAAVSAFDLSPGYVTEPRNGLRRTG